MIPGEIETGAGDIEINSGRNTVRVTVANSGDRPIQVGSHYHFYETNDSLLFERDRARGYRLNIAAGTAVRFEPGQTRNVELVEFAGARIVFGHTGKIMGPLDKAASTGAPGSGPGAAKKKNSKPAARHRASK